MIKFDEFIKKIDELENYSDKKAFINENRRYIPIVEKITIAKSIAMSVIFDRKGNVLFNTMYVDSLLIPAYFKAKFSNVDVSDYKAAELYDIIMSTPLLYNYVIEDTIEDDNEDYWIIQSMVNQCIEDAKINYTSNYALATVFAPQITNLMKKYVKDSGENILVEEDNEDNTHS